MRSVWPEHSIERAILRHATHAQALDLIGSFLVDLQLQLSKAESAAQDVIGAVECRACAQCSVLLVRQTSKESTHEHLVRVASVSATCAAIEMLRQPMLSAGMLDAVTPLLDTSSLHDRDDETEGEQSRNATSEGEAHVVTKLVLETVCSLLQDTSTLQDKAPVLCLISALAPLLSVPTPEPLSLLATQALGELINVSEHQRSAVAGTPAAVKALVAACKGAHRSQVLVEAVRALNCLAARDSYDVVLTSAGAVQALLQVCAHRTKPEHGGMANGRSMNDDESALSDKTICTALDALANLADSPIARRVIVDEGGVEVRVTTTNGVELACARPTLTSRCACPRVCVRGIVAAARAHPLG